MLRRLYLKPETCDETFSRLNQEGLSKLKEKLEKEDEWKKLSEKYPELVVIF